MRALLVVNPKATTTTERGRDVLVRALRSEVDLTVEYSRRRGHAAALGRQATAEGYQVLVTLGGDGTVNEVVNGLLAAGPGPAVPALAVVPGGSTNVFARALGLPRDWTEGTGVILEALAARRTRTIGLGQADGRYFTFCAGFGLDAEVIRSVERARLRGKASTPGLYARSTLAQLFLDRDRHAAAITLDRPGAPTLDGLGMVVVQNTAPWTYLGGRPVNACPEASFDTGLDLMGMRGLSLVNTARALTQIMKAPSDRPDRSDPHGPPDQHGPSDQHDQHDQHDRHMVHMHDLAEFTLRSRRPEAFQLDGDYLGERDKITFSAVRNALRVIC